MSFETPLTIKSTAIPRRLEAEAVDEEQTPDLPSISAQKELKKVKDQKKKTMEELKVMNIRLKSIKNKLMRVRSSLESSREAPNPNLKCKQFLQLQLKTLENAFAEYNMYHQRVFEADVADEIREEAEEAYVIFEQQYGELFISLTKLIDDNIKREEDAVRIAVPSISTTTTEAIPYLPPLKVPLPTFDGDYENWYTFRSMFETIMRRYSSEAPAIKLYHLRNSLVGKAAGIIDQEIINNNDYEAAWRMLIERFEDKRLIIDKHIDALFNLPRLVNENPTDLRKLIDTCTRHVDALRNLGLAVEGLGECMLINRIAAKLDVETRKAWELNQVDDDLPGYNDTLEFLRERCKVLEKIQPVVKQVPKIQKPSRSALDVKGRASSLVVTTEKCPQCSESHELWRCDTFKNAVLSEKYNLLRRIGACFNCLQRGHRTINCVSKYTCKKCRKSHHTILHPEDDTAKKPETSHKVATKPESTMKNAEQLVKIESVCATTELEQQSNFCMQPKNAGKQILLSTAVVLVYGKGDQLYPCRVLLDSGSHTSFVTEQFASLLGLKKECTNVNISCLNEIQTKVRLKIHTKVTSRVNDYTVCLELLVVPKITGILPPKKVHIAALAIPKDIELADPDCFVPDKVDMLLGADVFFDMLLTGRIPLPRSSAVLQETQFGWVLSGSVPTEDLRVMHSFCTTVADENVEALVQRFWEIESCGNVEPPRSTNEEKCIQHFETTHERTAEGRYLVRLPFNEKKDQLGDSRRMAEKRFYGLEKRLDRVPDVKMQYNEFLKEYEALGHMTENLHPDDAQAFYLPHHYVLKPTSTSTKLRVVFDGSAASDTGVSINQTQMIGPSVQNDLPSIIVNFRAHRFVFKVDVPKMYRQVAVHKDDRSYQRIVCRENRNDPLKTFDLNTVTYGLASSPFLATMSLYQLTEDEGFRYPLAAKAIKKSCYMDDVLVGANTIVEVIELKNQIVSLLERGCFSAHKIASNSRELLADIPESQKERGIEMEDHSINVDMKTLGIDWNPVEDQFTIAFPISPIDTTTILTKRTILSQIAKIFDPLGLVGPAITAAKLIMRELWSLNLDWDQPVPEAMAQLWRDYYQQLTSLTNVKIPRWILIEESCVIELHGFADASDLAYGACIYTRLKKSDGKADMKLVCSKSRVLPKKRDKQKQITTPRAELLAAVLLSRLAVKILTALEISFESCSLWSDSQIVLCWIRKAPEDLTAYVGNRVREIQCSTRDCLWKYIPSRENPADCISRGIPPRKLETNALWWTGPTMLHVSEPTIAEPSPMADEDIPEVKKTVLVAAMQEHRLPLFDRISRFLVIQRAMAYVVRFCDYIRSGRKKLMKGCLTTDELSRSSILIVRLVQAEGFSVELKLLQMEGSRSKQPFPALNPFIDPRDGVLRVGGRLKNADVPYDYKHQALLPERHPLTVTLIRYLHQCNLHIGQRSLLAIVRQRYWPLHAKNIIRKVIHRCIPCYRLRPTKSTQLMGDLPNYRVQQSFPFARTGLDFAGPFKIRSSHKLRNAQTTKGYVCVFVCMATRALHLEVVSDLTSEAFLGALQRFVSRRGLVECLYSDNATNFEGANNELQRLAELFRDEQHRRGLDGFCTQRGIKWSFIPPRSPHFGGIWEAGVKSVKLHLKKILAEHNLSNEQFSTVLTQIEAVLNSRPLTPSSDDPNDFRAITPAHFLIGREFQTISEPSYKGIPPGRLSKWQFLQDLKQKFWNLWMTHYLHELQQRQKDFKVTSFKVGALVLIVDENVPPLQWMLARITELIPGSDGHTRVVGLRLSNGTTTRRAVKKICLLPLDAEEDQPERIF